MKLKWWLSYSKNLRIPHHQCLLQHQPSYRGQLIQCQEHACRQSCLLLALSLLILVKLVEAELFLPLLVVLGLMVQSVPNTQEYVKHKLFSSFKTLSFHHTVTYLKTINTELPVTSFWGLGNLNCSKWAKVFWAHGPIHWMWGISLVQGFLLQETTVNHD